MTNPNDLQTLDFTYRKVLGLRPVITNHRGKVVSKRAKIMVWESAEDGRPWFDIEALAKLFNRSIARTRDAVRYADLEAPPGMTRKVKSNAAPKVAVDVRLVDRLFEGCRSRVADQVRQWFNDSLKKFSKRVKGELVKGEHPFAKAVGEFEPFRAAKDSEGKVEVREHKKSSSIEEAITIVVREAVASEVCLLSQQVDKLQMELKRLKDKLRNDCII